MGQWCLPVRGKHSPLQDALAGPEVPLGNWLTGNTALWSLTEENRVVAEISVSFFAGLSVQERARLTLQGKRENQCVLLFVAPTALLMMLSEVVFNTGFKAKM